MEYEYQIFAETKRSFEQLQKVKRYQYLAYFYALLGALFILVSSVLNQWWIPCCGIICICTLVFYLYRSKQIDKSILDLNDCNIIVENDLISVHQAAENGTYETFNLYLSEIAEIYAKKNIPKFYIKMKNKIINSSFYIDGQKLDRFLAAEVDGRDYNLNEFRKAYQLLVENISDYSLEDAAMIVGNDEKWKIKREKRAFKGR